MLSKKEKLRRLLKKYIDPIIPLYALLPLVTCLMVNNIVYFVIRKFTGDMYHHDLTTAFDRMVPFIPEWVSIYFICYVFWVFNYILIMRQGKENGYRFMATDISSRLICGIFYYFFPTTNIRPQVIGTGIWNELMRWLYEIDAPSNLFPSIHCLVSWLCYIGIRKNKNIPVCYRAFSCIFALLVMASTQFTKQHYIVDVFGAVVIAEVLYWFFQHFDYYKKIMPVFEKLSGKLFGMENI